METEEEKQFLLENSDNNNDGSAPPPPTPTISHRLRYAACLVPLLLCFLAGLAIASAWHPSTKTSTATTDSSANSDHSPGHWVATWTAAPQGEPLKYLPSGFYRENVTLSDDSVLQDLRNPFMDPVTIVLENSTIRQTHTMSIGADKIRVRLSNAAGTTDLRVEKVTIAITETERILNANVTSGSSSLLVPTLQTLTFSGRPSIRIPLHGLAVSDALDFPIQPDQVITVTMYFRHGQVGDIITGHDISKTTTYMAKGDHTATESLRSIGAQTVPHWFVASGIEAWKSPEFSALVVLGDSITDHGSHEVNSDYRWPNFLSTRMQSSSNTSLHTISVVSQAQGGNRLMFDGKGPNLISRLDRDVLAVSGVKYVMMLEGILDVDFGNDEARYQRIKAERLKVHYQQVATRLHTAGLPVFASTLTPQSCTPDIVRPGVNGNAPYKEAERLRMNAWLRDESPFDAIVDFDSVLRNPENHTVLLPAYDSGDCMHPSAEGLHAMANAFPLDWFEKFKNGVDPSV